MDIDTTSSNTLMLAKPIRPLRITDSMLRLFIINDGSADNYISHLSAHIKLELSIYSIHAELRDRAPITIEERAWRAVSLIQSVQSHGPYYILGHCACGTIAYEIAVHLIGANEDVAFLGLLETAFYNESSYAHLHSHIAPNSRNWPTFSNALAQYSPIKVPILLHLFSTQHALLATPALGWGSVLPKDQIDEYAIPTDHNSLPVTPCYAALGVTLSRVIENSLSTTIKPLEATYNPTVTLQVGRSDVVPLICLPGAGATIASFADLLLSFDKSIPISGLEPRGLDGTLVPYSTVQAAAHSYIAAIRQTHPRTPVHLFGHSFGGWVAFEIAQSMLSSELASITILDSDAPPHDPSDSNEFTNTDVFMKCVEVYELLLERQLNIERSDIEHLDTIAQRTILHRRLIAARLLPQRSNAAVLRGPLQTFAMSLRTHYTPEKVYRGSLNLFLMDAPYLSPDENRRRRESRISAWRQWAPNLMPKWLPGNHMTILRAPHVHVLECALGKIVLGSR